MGSANSRLKVPLVPQPKPARATRLSMVSTHATSLCVDLTGTNTTYRIVDAHSGTVFHDLTPEEASKRRTIRSVNGVPLATMKPTAKGVFAVYDVGSDAEPLAHIRVKRGPKFPTAVYAEFQDVATGETCRLVTRGYGDDRVVLVLLERGANLAPIESTEHSADAAVVARIRRPKTDGVLFLEGREKMYIEAEAGVDLTLLSLLWCVRYELYFEDMCASGAFGLD